MRVVECDECGAVISAANDDELVASLCRHLQSEHPRAQADEEHVRALVRDEAYDALDS